MFQRVFFQTILILGICLTISCSKRDYSISQLDKKGKIDTNKKVIAQLKNQYWDFYHGREELTIRSIEELPGNNIKIKLILQPNIKNFSHFMISTDKSEFQKSPDGNIVANFSISNTSPQETNIVLKMISNDGEISKPYIIRLICNTKKYWESKGAMGYPNWITVKTYPFINFTPSYSIENWIYKKPSSEEKRYAQEKWGNLIENTGSNYEKAKLLGKILLDDLKPHVGVPSDSMKVPAFEQYERMISGKDRGFCTNFANIFICACNSLGIPARRIHLEKVHSRYDKCSIRMGGMHSTTEIFDEQLDQWIWFDLNSNALGAFLGQEGPLTMAEFCIFLNQKERRKNLRLLIYNYKDKTEKILPLDKCPKKEYASFDGWDTEFHYFYSPSNKNN